MPEPKTKKTRASVDGFLDSIKDEQRSADCRSIRQIMEKATASKGQMWGAGIMGFGETRRSTRTAASARGRESRSLRAMTGSRFMSRRTSMAIES